MNRRKNNFLIYLVLIIIVTIFISKLKLLTKNNYENNFNILSSYENKYIEKEILNFAKKNKINIKFTYMGDLDIVDELNNNSSKYDAVWISNSMWYYMLDNPYLASNSKSISISPVVFGIKKSKAKELGLIDKEITNNDILSLIQDKKIKYVMSSVTQTNTGATAYFGFLNSLAGNPEILTSEMLQNDELINNLKALFSGVERVSGEEDFLKKMFLNSNEYDAVIADESSLININLDLVKKNKEELYLIYPKDGVAVNDSSFGFINNNNTDKEEQFLKLQSYLLSDEGQKILENYGKRTWYGGYSKNAPKNIFNPKWGIKTEEYLNVTKFPSKDIMTEALNIYIEEIRKPTHVVFCLDYSGSMSGKGIEELREAMNYILDYEKSSKDKLQFSKDDKITVITFSTNVTNVWHASGMDTQNLINNINEFYVGGGTALYDAVIRGLDILKNESDDYTKTIITMTDGEINEGSFKYLESQYNNIKNIPIYSIMFGNASDKQLNEIAELSNARVFDGKTNLLKAFKEVRGYN